MLEEKIKSKSAFNRNIKENMRLYSVALALSSMIGCNSFNYPQTTKEFTLTCAPYQTLYCSKPQGNVQTDCTCYDNPSSTPQDDLWVRLW